MIPKCNPSDSKGANYDYKSASQDSEYVNHDPECTGRYLYMILNVPLLASSNALPSDAQERT